MRWKQFMRLAVISMAFMVLFSSLWYYSDAQNSPVRIHTSTYLDYCNSTLSIKVPVSLLSTEQIVSYGNGGVISYYDGLKINSTIHPIMDEFVVYINSTHSSTRLVVNNLSYGSVGNLKLSLRPGTYNVTAVFYIVMPASEMENLSSILSEIGSSGHFITIVIRPTSTLYVYPFLASVAATGIFTGISFLEIRRFNRSFKRK